MFDNLTFYLSGGCDDNSNHLYPGQSQPGQIAGPGCGRPGEDLICWVKTDRKTALRVLKLAEAVLHDPFNGPGKPEPLKYLGAGVWSRRITQKHRLVYLVGQERLDLLQARYHY
jgi:toxin YoeB